MAYVLNTTYNVDVLAVSVTTGDVMRQTCLVLMTETDFYKIKEVLFPSQKRRVKRAKQRRELSQSEKYIGVYAIETIMISSQIQDIVIQTLLYIKPLSSIGDMPHMKCSQKCEKVNNNTDTTVCTLIPCLHRVCFNCSVKRNTCKKCDTRITAVSFDPNQSAQKYCAVGMLNRNRSQE